MEDPKIQFFFYFSEWQMRNQHWTKWFPPNTERFSYQNCVQICRIPPYQMFRNCVQICRMPFDTEWFSYQNCVQICPYPIEYSPKKSQLCVAKTFCVKGEPFSCVLGPAVFTRKTVKTQYFRILQPRPPSGTLSATI